MLNHVKQHNVLLLVQLISVVFLVVAMLTTKWTVIHSNVDSVHMDVNIGVAGITVGDKLSLSLPPDDTYDPMFPKGSLTAIRVLLPLSVLCLLSAMYMYHMDENDKRVKMLLWSSAVLSLVSVVVWGAVIDKHITLADNTKQKSTFGFSYWLALTATVLTGLTSARLTKM